MISQGKNGLKNLILAVVLLVAAAACAQPEVPTDYFYRLRASMPEAPFSAPLLQGTVEVELSADGLVDGRNVIHSEASKPNELKEYHYHFWAEPPKIMVRDQLIAYLRAANVAPKVVTHEIRADPKYVITGKIKRLEKIVGDKPRAMVELEMALTETASGKLLILETYGIGADADSNTVAAAVAAIDKALSQIFARFVADIAKL
ncbi:MAG: hypothetical protein A3G18_06360 [Rhodospirillales bacterium RIFCSPLOWO2_12_FULL_58_28]|nr:MAG: hypothetical protein A3H92_04175 [Rhodospirillales bacterium RIFCSPLOWO2_02_FULL_58_16]OHC76806.1 MAG: hypothetical protein A3G18_06360 [Rhodospirillales bacterium RIFCSPLOWO2_12_FULL_58_28]